MSKHRHNIFRGKVNCTLALNIMSFVILALGISEMLMGLLQITGVTYSLHSRYIATGNFYNPGPYACYLAVSFPIAISWTCTRDSRIKSWIGIGYVMICVLLISLTMSRTAIIACTAGSVIALWNKIGRIHLTKWQITYSAAICVVLIGSFYYVKKDSADGRMLMWKVALKATNDVPATGVGWQNVAGAYGIAQEKHFASGKSKTQEILVADAPKYVFNEYLQTAIAYGPVAACVLIFLVTGGIILAITNKSYAFAGSASAAAIVMFASYPLQFPFFAVTIAIILSGAWLSSSSKVTGLAGCIITVTACTLFLKTNDTIDVHTEFNVAHSMHQSGDYRGSNARLLRLLDHSADPMILNIIGKNYKAMRQPDSAEHYFRRAANRCPNRLYPHYLLMHLYGDSAYLDKKAERQEAEYILTVHEKISSPAIDDMRREARKILGYD